MKAKLESSVQANFSWLRGCFFWVKNLAREYPLMTFFVFLLFITSFVSTSYIPKPFQLTHKFQLSVVVKSVSFDLASNYELPVFYDSSDAGLTLKNVVTEADIYRAKNIVDIFNTDHAQTVRTRSTAEGALAQLQQLSLSSGGKLTVSRDDANVTQFTLCGKHEGAVWLKGAIAIDRTTNADEQPFNLTLDRPEMFRFSSIVGEPENCTDTNSGVIGIYHDDNRRREIGTFRINDVVFEQFRNDSKLATKVIEGSIISGSITGPKLKRSLSLASGDNVSFQNLTSASVRSFEYDERERGFKLLISGEARKITVAPYQFDSQNKSEGIKLAPSLLSFGMSYPLVSIFLGFFFFRGSSPKNSKLAKETSDGDK